MKRLIHQLHVRFCINQDIIAVSTNNPDPLNAFAQYYEATSKENLFQVNYADPDVLRYYVLVHDLKENPKLEECVIS